MLYILLFKTHEIP